MRLNIFKIVIVIVAYSQAAHNGFQLFPSGSNNGSHKKYNEIEIVSITDLAARTT